MTSVFRKRPFGVKQGEPITDRRAIIHHIHHT